MRQMLNKKIQQASDNEAEYVLLEPRGEKIKSGRLTLPI